MSKYIKGHDQFRSFLIFQVKSASNWSISRILVGRTYDFPSESLKKWFPLNPFVSVLHLQMVELCPNYFLHKKIHSKLYPYQREGIKWMYSLFERKKGGVLGDDMGLGKTVQVISFLAGKVFIVTKLHIPSWFFPTWSNDCPKEWMVAVAISFNFYPFRFCRFIRYGENFICSSGASGVSDWELVERVREVGTWHQCLWPSFRHKQGERIRWVDARLVPEETQISSPKFAVVF